MSFNPQYKSDNFIGRKLNNGIRDNLVKVTNKEKKELPECIVLYNKILTGECKTFPYGYWNSDNSKENASILIRFLLEEILDWDEEDIKDNLTVKVFTEYGLGNMMYSVFNGYVYLALQEAYPNRFCVFDLCEKPSGFWTEEMAILGLRWLLEYKLGWDDEQIRTKINLKIIRENKLSGALLPFDNSIFKALDATYPGKFKIFILF